MKIEFVKTESGMIPHGTDNSAKWLNFRAKLPLGAIAILEVSRDRSTAQHRQYWTVLNSVFKNLREDTPIKTADELHFATKYQHCLKYPEMLRIIHTMHGEEIKTVFSESTSSGITQEQMNRYYNDALTVWADMLGCTAGELVGSQEC